MKRITYIYMLVSICGIGLLGSCKDFLEESSQDEVRPTTTADLLLLMNGAAYPYTTPLESYIDLLTDEMKCNGLPLNADGTNNATYLPYLDNGTPFFTWNPTMFDKRSTSLLFGQDSWKDYYKLINGCNLITDYTTEVTGTEEEKNAMMGQVLFLRAFYYLKLVNLYCKPYSGAGSDPENTDGVPLILSSIVSDERKPRNTLQEVYVQIEKDLLQAAYLLKMNYTPSTKFRVGHTAACALLSRVYLYKGGAQDLDKAIQYADTVITNNSFLTQLKSYFTGATSYNNPGIYDVASNFEVIWCYGNNPSNTTLYVPGINTVLDFDPPFSVSDELISLYDKGTNTTTNLGDLRYTFYFWKYKNKGVFYPYRSSKINTSQPYGDRGIRLAEIYLNRAEALILRYKETGQAEDLTQALSDLNTLRQSRYDTRNVDYTPVDISKADDLYTFYKEERRRELCLEDGHRWIDIKRWGVPVTHDYIDASGVHTAYTLEAGSLIYALPIPYTAIENNVNLAQNPR